MCSGCTVKRDLSAALCCGECASKIINRAENGKEILQIAMLGHKRVPSREGGIEVVAGELCARMALAGHDVTCYNRGGHHVSGAVFDSKAANEHGGICLKTVPTINLSGLAAATSSLFASLFAAAGSYDVVHIHAEGPALFCWIPKLFGKRVIVTVHGIDHLRAAKHGRLGCAVIKQGEKTAVRFADEIIVLSNRVQEYFRREYGRSTVFIPNGVNRPVRKDAREIAEKWGLTNGSYFLYLGRLVAEKGLVYLVEAYHKVKSGKKLVIAGGASDSGKFVKRLLGLAASDERIIFTGFVQGQILEELYSNAYAYVLPSDLEGMPLSLLEAMSYGNCCIVSDIAECTEVVEDKAITFRKGNVEDLREKLQRCCDDEKMVEEYRQTAAEHVLSRYNWDDVTERTLQVYYGEYEAGGG